MMKKETKNHSIADKFYVAFRGMILPFKTELSIRIQLVIAIGATSLGFYLDIQKSDWLWIVIAAALVLITETLNTAIEKLVDLVSPEYNALAGYVKDVAAGAVFMAAIASIIIALLIFVPYF